MFRRMMILAAAAACTLSTLALAPAPAAPAAPAQDEVDESYVAYAISMGNIATGRRSRVTVYITGWTTDEERQALAQDLVSGGNDALRASLEKAREVGRIRIGTRSTYPLTYAREFELETGIRRLVLATYRPIAFLEAINSSRSSDYSLSLIILDLEPDGTGSGIAAAGVNLQINPDNGVLQIENYGTEPARITNLKRER